jgi:MFS family permease
MTVNNDYWGHLAPGMIVMGAGLGATFVSVLVAATSGVPGHLSGLASGLVNTAQQIGGSLGLAVLSGIAASSAMRYAVHAHAHNTAAIAVSTVHGYRTGFYVAVCFSLAASAIALIVIKQKGKVTVDPAAMAAS